MKRSIIFSLLTAISFVFFSCDNSQAEYIKAKEINTIHSYEDFISSNEGSIFVDSARTVIQALKLNSQKQELDNLSVIGKTEAYEKYLLKYPDGYFVDSVKAIIYNREYRKAKSRGTLSSLRNYQSNYPDNPFYKEVVTRIKKLEYRYSDAGIKKSVQAFFKKRSECYKKPTISVKNGFVKISENCLSVARCQGHKGMLKAISAGRKCKQFLKDIENEIKVISGVKGVTTLDLAG